MRRTPLHEIPSLFVDPTATGGGGKVRATRPINATTVESSTRKITPYLIVVNRDIIDRPFE
jgi:hypothetical protein